MKNNTKSSITLPPHELKMVNELMKVLKSKSKVDVIRRGLYLLKESVDRKSLRESFRQAALAVGQDIKQEIAELDSLSDEGLD